MSGLTLLTPEAGLVGAVVALPLAAFAVATRRSERARSLLRLPPAPPERRPLLIGAAFALLALAATQPALERERVREVRTDTEVLLVLDVSRSMAAASSAGRPTRLDRAKDVARAVRSRLDGVPTGVATFTDRMLPHLFPTGDTATFEATLEKAVGIERPPAQDQALQATTLGALAQAAQGRYFSAQARRRLLVVLTDGDSAPFDVSAVARALDAARIRLQLVRVGDAAERVYGPGGTPEPLYRPSATAAQTLAALADAANGVVSGAGDAVQAADDFVGRGPSTTEGIGTDVVSLAGAFAAAALVPLGLLLLEGLPRRGTMRLGWPRAAIR